VAPAARSIAPRRRRGRRPDPPTASGAPLSGGRQTAPDERHWWPRQQTAGGAAAGRGRWGTRGRHAGGRERGGGGSDGGASDAPDGSAAGHDRHPGCGAGSQHELKHVSYECFSLALSILSLANIVPVYRLRQPGVEFVVAAVDLLLSRTFPGDFAYRLLTAPTNRGCPAGQRGWLDLPSSLPQAKVFRLLREVGPRRFFDAVLRDRAGSALLVVPFLASCCSSSAPR
jgi:hypothetical protein